MIIAKIVKNENIPVLIEVYLSLGKKKYTKLKVDYFSFH